MRDIFDRLKIYLNLLIVIIFAAGFYPVYAQEILMRTEGYSTELFLRVQPNQIRSVEQDGASIFVNFITPIQQPFSRKFDDRYISSITGSGNRFVITFHLNTDFGAFYDPHGLRFIASKPRELDSVLMSYSVGAPMLRKENIHVEDPALDAQLAMAEEYTRNKQYVLALNTLKNIISNSNNPFYIQDAFFRLGSVYMDMAAANPSAYTNAALAFDDFLIRYPSSNRVLQAKIFAAMAKENSGAMSEAIVTYRDIFQTAPDMEIRRSAISRIGDLYAELGDNKRAIDAYETYLQNFKADTDRINTILGHLYLIENIHDKAYALFENTPVPVLLAEYGDSELLNLARIFRDEGREPEALQMYRQLVNRSPTESINAWNDLVDIYKKNGDKSALALALINIMALSGADEDGLHAMIEFAELNYKERTADEWRDFFTPLYADPDDVYHLRPRAEMVLLKALRESGDTFPLVNKINEYVQFYAEDEEKEGLLQIKEDVLFKRAIEYQNNKSYADALVLYRQVLSEFPETLKRPEITQRIDDIYFDRASMRAENKQHLLALEAVENWMLEHPGGVDDRWRQLWEDMMFKNLETNISNMPNSKVRLYAREYLAFAPRGDYVANMREILERSFMSPYTIAFDEGNYSEIVALYVENLPWLELWPNQSFSNRAKITAAQALIRLGVLDKANELYDTAVPIMEPIYAEVGYALCKDRVNYNINKLSTDEFERVVNESKQCRNIDYTLDLLQQYSKDKQLSLKMQLDIAKDFTNSVRKEKEYNRIYQQLVTDSDSRFTGYEEVYLETGMLAFKRNDFNGALLPLQYYSENVPDTSEKKAQALYYIGRSLMNTNERDRALDYFKRVVNMPDGMYKTMAENELEDDAWKRGETGRASQ